jgi:2-oxoisovalerate dehydrogenase E1 component alpha subunit
MDKRPLQLHIPAPACRPGDAVDFSGIQVPAAGLLKRPAESTSPEQMRDYAYSLIRVLDDKGKAVGEWNPKLSADTLRTGLRHMVLTREFDERMVKLQRQGKTSFYIKCTG